MKENKIRQTYRVDPHLIEYVKTMADNFNVSISHIIREGIRMMAKKHL